MSKVNLEGFKKVEGSSLKNEILSGITVALALVPEAIAFAFVAGVDPKIGLYTAFIIGFIWRKTGNDIWSYWSYCYSVR